MEWRPTLAIEVCLKSSEHQQAFSRGMLFLNLHGSIPPLFMTGEELDWVDGAMNREDVGDLEKVV